MSCCFFVLPWAQCHLGDLISYNQCNQGSSIYILWGFTVTYQDYEQAIIFFYIHNSLRHSVFTGLICDIYRYLKTGS